MKSLLLSILGAVFFVSAAQASGPQGPFYKHFNKQNGVAIQGYDVVSYFKGSPQQGTKRFSVDYRDVIFHFATKANADEFDVNPEKYVPAYGGWCATAIGMMNQKLDINPTSYEIQDGVLYLFSTSMGPAKEQWNSNLPGVKQNADANWAKIIAN